jgi:hypothetical protein
MMLDFFPFMVEESLSQTLSKFTDKKGQVILLISYSETLSRMAAYLIHGFWFNIR